MIQFAAAELEKIAIEWTPAKARALEAGVGAAGGAVLGGLAGRGTYTPHKPVHRIDPQGYLMQRELDPTEKKERWGRTWKAGALGAGLGAGASLGVSKGLRFVLDDAEREQLAYAKKNALPIKLIKEQMEASEEAIDRIRAAPTPGADAEDAQELAHEGRRVIAAKRLLEEEEQRLINLATTAREYRHARPYGHVPDVADTRYPPGHANWRKSKDPSGSLLSSMRREGIDLDDGTMAVEDRRARAPVIRQWVRDVIEGRSRADT